jgi:hypothetical protein
MSVPGGTHLATAIANAFSRADRRFGMADGPAESWIRFAHIIRFGARLALGPML